MIEINNYSAMNYGIKNFTFHLAIMKSNIATTCVNIWYYSMLWKIAMYLWQQFGNFQCLVVINDFNINPFVEEAFVSSLIWREFSKPFLPVIFRGY